MYLDLKTASNKLKLSESELLTRRALSDILYSEKTDKYEIDSILQTRTMTLGIDKFFNDSEKSELIKIMQSYASLKFKIFKEITKGTKFKNNGTDRLHRIIAKEINPTFTNLIADTALADAQGLYKSSLTWKDKSEKNLMNNIKELETKLLRPGLKLESIKKLKHSLFFKKFKLRKSQSKDYKSVWFGGKHLKGDIQDLEQYKLSRLELFIQGTAGEGNKKIGINYSKDGNDYELRIFDKVINKVKIPSSHRDFFNLNYFNRQSSRISFNKLGKLVLNVTYSFIKPMKLDNHTKSRGTIGIDIGPKEIAISFVKNDGNPFKYKHYNIANILDSRNEEKQRILSNLIDEIISEAKAEGFYHITIENLDNLNFKKSDNRNLNRMLAKFPKTIFEDLIMSKCARKGIKIKKVNPAYTSIIGLFKYSNRDNLSTSHNSKSHDLSAALVIGRRGLGIIEKPIVSIRVFKRLISIPIYSLFNSPEDELRKKDWNYKSFNHLWKSLKTEFNSVNALTEHIYVQLQLGVQVQLTKMDNRYRFPSSIRNDTTDILPF